MKLVMRSFQVTEASFGKRTTFSDGVLVIDQEQVRALVLRNNKYLDNVEIALAQPGQKVRIIHVLDAVEPRLKVTMGDSAFPGFLGFSRQAGNGITHRLQGVAILICAEFPEYGADSQMGANEGIVDMAGPVTSLSPFGSTINLVFYFRRKPAAKTADFASAVRMASFKVAHFLAETVRTVQPDKEDEYSLEVGVPTVDLPRVAAVFLLPSLFSNTLLPLREFFIYGQPVGGMLPTLLHPNEVLDGAVVNGYFVHGGIQNATYFYQNNPVLAELYRSHGRGLNCVGVIATRSGEVDNMNKLNYANRAGILAELLHLDGVVVSSGGGGHHVVDFMMVCQQIERRGIKTVGIIGELANVDGGDFGLPFSVPEADALVSVGNREEPVELPPVDEVIGGENLLDGKSARSGQVRVGLRNIFCSTTQLGAWRISARPFYPGSSKAVK